MFFARIIALCLFCLIAATSVSFSQTDQAPQFDAEAVTELATRAENALSEAQASDAALQELRSQLAEIRTEILDAQAIRKERADALQTQVDALGPPPEEGILESEEAAARRAELDKQLTEARSLEGFAKESFERVNALVGQIDKELRDRQSKVLLSLGTSPVLPSVLAEATAALGEYYREFTTEVAEAWGNDANQAVRKNNLPAIVLLLILGVAFILPARIWLVRIWDRGSAQKRPGAEGLYRFVISLLVLTSPLVGLALIVRAIVLAQVVTFRGLFLLQALPVAGVAFFGAIWLSRNLLPVTARDRPLSAMRGWSGRAGRRTITLLGIVFAFKLLLDRVSEGQNWSENVYIALLFPLTLAGGAGLLRIAFRLWTTDFEKVADGEKRSLAERLSRWISYASLAGGFFGPLVALIGYSRLGSLIVFSSLQTLALIATLLVVFRLLVQLGGIFESRTRKLHKEEQEADSGFLYKLALAFVLACVAVPFLALIWGVSPGELGEIWLALREGISFGGTRISISEFLAFVLIFFLGYTLTRLIQGGLRSVVLPNTRLDKGAQNALVTGAGYVGLFLAVLIAVLSTGLDLTSLTIVAGALSVGIGFGLQTIVSNFVSGIILLIERPIKEGDWIEVSQYSGNVAKISVRSTTIDTFDRATVIVPNADLIAGTVVNWTLQSLNGRVRVPVGVSYDSDPEQVRDLLLKIARDHPQTLSNPEPVVLFMGFGADSLNFELRAILRDVNYVLQTHSEMNFEIVRVFRENGIEIPFAQRDVTIKNAKDFLPAQRPSKDGSGE